MRRQGYTPEGEGNKSNPPRGSSAVTRYPCYGAVPNSVVLMFVRGWQGGTINQIAAELDVTPQEILSANINRMGELMRVAQAKLRYEIVKRYVHEGLAMPGVKQDGS